MNFDQRPMAINFTEYVSNPDNFSSIVGIPSEIAVRLPGFAAFGIKGEQLVEAVRKAGPERGPATPEWSTILMDYGDRVFAKGERAGKMGECSIAEQAFLEASFWYFFARFPHILHTEANKAYLLHKKAYLRSTQYSQYTTEIIEIPYDNQKGEAILRLPKSTKSKLPLVIIWGGIDVWKSDLEIHAQGNRFLEQNIAVLAIDMPGTGECPVLVSTSAHMWYLAVLDYIKTESRIDADRIGCYGLSFGGYWAVKLALLETRLVAAVNNAGPIHHTFQRAWVEKLPFGIKAALSRVCGLPLNNSIEFFNTLENLSLYRQNLLPTSAHADILSLNGKNDELVPIQDLYFLQEQGIQQDSLIFAQDRHVASRNWHLHERFVADWMAKKLKVQ